MRVSGAVTARLVALGVVVAVAQLPSIAWPRKPRPTPCAGGRFVVHEAPLVGDAVGPSPDVIVFDAAQVAVASGCRATAVRRTASKRGTTLKATWPSCAGATGPVRLKAKVDPTCGTMTGTLVAKKARPRLRRRFTAGLEQCEAGGDCGAATATVRYCHFVPGMSQPATMPPDVVSPPPTTSTTLPPLPPPSVVPPATTQAQAAIFTDIRDVVTQTYVYPDFGGVDWTALADGYAALIQAGLTDDDFYAAMQRMIRELGDRHSYFQTPEEVQAEEEEQANGQNFVGIGVLVLPLPGTSTGAVIVTYPGGPARDAGLLPHDLLLTVDGQPAFDAVTGATAVRGPENSQFELGFQRPGEAPRTVTLTRRRITGFTPIDACVVPTTRIGYVLVPTFSDLEIDDQVRTALGIMTAAGPLEGLVVDDRVNGGGSSLVLLPMLGLFTSGLQGQIVERSDATALDVTAADVGGTQTVPLALLADRSTVSFAEVFTGVLQHAGRGRVIGGPTAGNVELLFGSTFADGSRLWLASATFAPNGLAPGVWEGVGIIPDEAVPTRWDLFAEGTDPALAAAVDALRAGAPVAGSPTGARPPQLQPLLREVRSGTRGGRPGAH